jgi:replication factor C subunit 2/4
LVAKIITHCQAGTLSDANELMMSLCSMGYSAMDIITTVFRVVRNYDMEEFLKLEFIKVGLCVCVLAC